MNADFKAPMILMFVGFAMVFAGIAIMTLSTMPTFEQGETHVTTGGAALIFIGPIPVILAGGNASLAIMMAMLAAIVAFLMLIFLKTRSFFTSL
ncbi:MAG: hypothetical protein DRJ31_06340 [Candidatus Methanomethylicota archaeon]|uniref:TIGR00304 family protein n=1 Tax=Thermoproteota archaeon TaxID=2056631 RepID=A0A497EN77_9CREN|nr:MAG: hypothetical protein DRJ31_06340 [Candidatus Verstraetearchaeota archaeon]RLE52565.1 MAG: hypothetical protein DRJ33_03445 [Candidatus Verstraetearchaeota archaeon]